MSNKRTVYDFDWAMYVDASGDDGFAFDHGSSTTFTVNCFMCPTSEIEYNKEVLNSVKLTVGCLLDEEMKSGTIVRSKKRPEVCRLLSTLHGALFQVVLFKKSIDISSFSKEERKKHVFSILAHSFTVLMAATFHRHFHQSVCIVIDNMKSDEVIGTKENLRNSLEDVDCEILFADSKSKIHTLLQISDYFAGLTNQACAFHEKAIQGNPSLIKCTTCRIKNSLCRRKPDTIQTPIFYDIQKYVNLYTLFTDMPEDVVIGNGIRMLPEIYLRRYKFFDCVLHQHGQAIRKRQPLSSQV